MRPSLVHPVLPSRGHFDMVAWAIGMRPTDDARAWVVMGALGAVLLGVALIPLRSVTSASNLAFVFLVFTIAVAEFGGRLPALVTAVVSAVSLNFFLTEPYLNLAISKRDDVIAFVALAVCGLIAAAFGRRRARWTELAGRASEELDVVRRLVEQVRKGAALEEILGELRESLGLAAVVLRADQGKVLAAVPADAAATTRPQTPLDRETLLPSDETHLRFGSRGLRLPEGGGRLRLRSRDGTVTLEMWEGDPRGFGVYETRALAIAASLLELEMTRAARR